MERNQPLQPLHPDIIPRLDIQYAKFHNENFLYLVPLHTIPWDPSIRNQPAVPGATPPLEVASTQDFPITYTSLRVFTPTGEAPATGWPAIIYFHGGGWTLGGISSEMTIATNMAQRARCVVISVDYRLAPENPYPAAVEDAVDSLQWVYANGKEKLNIDTRKIAVGGSSSGGNLAAVLAIKSSMLSPPCPVIFQCLIVPVTDNTAVDTPETSQPSWHELRNTPWLSPARMKWFKNNYLPNPEEWTKWDASPIFATDEMLRKTPSAWIGVCELDILRDEGLKYGERLLNVGVKVETKIYKGAPHPIMAMDGVLEIGKHFISDAVEALASAFRNA